LHVSFSILMVSFSIVWSCIHGTSFAIMWGRNLMLLRWLSQHHLLKNLPFTFWL
jgi:hypothetical protein